MQKVFEKGTVEVLSFLRPPARHHCSNLSCRLPATVRAGGRANFYLSPPRNYTLACVHTLEHKYICKSKVRFIVYVTCVSPYALPTLRGVYVNADFRARRLSFSPCSSCFIEAYLICKGAVCASLLFQSRLSSASQVSCA